MNLLTRFRTGVTVRLPNHSATTPFATLTVCGAAIKKAGSGPGLYSKQTTCRLHHKPVALPPFAGKACHLAILVSLFSMVGDIKGGVGAVSSSTLNFFTWGAPSARRPIPRWRSVGSPRA